MHPHVPPRKSLASCPGNLFISLHLPFNRPCAVILVRWWGIPAVNPDYWNNSDSVIMKKTNSRAILIGPDLLKMED
jgi:hypothetical protein